MPALGTVLSTTSIATSAEFDDHSARHENGGADEISIAGLSGTLADPQTAAAHAASHEDGGADALEVTDLATAETDDTLVLAPDGAGGVEFRAEAGGGGVTDADYLVGTAHAGLSAEIVVGASPGGELGGTWALPTVDATHSGSAHHDAVTVGTGLDVTGQLVELDLSEVAAGGELGGFMDAPTVDATHSGSTHAATQAAAESTAAGALSSHVGDVDPHTGYVREADASWIDLTDGGATTLHSHAGGGGLSAAEVGARVALGA